MHKKILEMIESVDPSDAETLDEIELSFWIWFYNLNPEGYDTGFTDLTPWSKEDFINDYGVDYHIARSRDALKSIRPEGWFFEVFKTVEAGAAARLVFITERGETGFGAGDRGRRLPTEELAELHAIIQAIAFYRQEME